MILSKGRRTVGPLKVPCLSQHYHLNLQEMNLLLCVHAKLLQSCLTLCDPMNCSLPGSSVYGDCPGKNTGVGCHVLLQEILPTQVSNPGLVHCRQILGHLSHEGSPRILKWVVYPFSRDGLRLGFPEL